MFIISAVLILLGVILYIAYLRYFPIKGIPCVEITSNQLEHANIKLDVRDYNVSAKKEVNGSIVMPIAYLKRYYREIPNKEVHIIASDRMEKNLGIRFLRNKGYHITGYTLMDCDCKS